jgi:uncharacterized protein involved in exopolysaccharide biosynthesis
VKQEIRQKETEFNFATILDFFLEYKVPIFIITVLAGILAFIFSGPYFIPPKFKSTVILYPATTNSISKALMSTNGSKEDLLAFGADEEAEQLLQLLQSDEITGKIIKKYDLMKHYRIDPNKPFPNTRLVKHFYNNVNYRRTEYLSIEISVLDESADTAAKIANDIALLVDSTKNDVQRKRAVDALKIIQEKYDEKVAFVNKMVDSLSKLGEMGVPQYSVQGSSIDEAYIKALSSGNQTVINELRKQKELLGKYGAVQKSFLDKIEFENKELSDLRARLEEARVDAEKMLPATFIVNKATPAERKYYPVRSLIVLISMASAFALSILFFAFLSHYRQYRSEKRIMAAAGRNKELADA